MTFAATATLHASNAENDNAAAPHARAVQWLSEVPTFLLHAVEALAVHGEEGGAMGMVDRATALLVQIRAEIEEPKRPHPSREPDPQFLSKGCPENTDTVLGFIARHNPELIDAMPDPVADIQHDHAGLRFSTRQGGQEPVRVMSSPAVLATRREWDWAYPVEHLAALYL